MLAFSRHSLLIGAETTCNKTDTAPQSPFIFIFFFISTLLLFAGSFSLFDNDLLDSPVLHFEFHVCVAFFRPCQQANNQKTTLTSRIVGLARACDLPRRAAAPKKSKHVIAAKNILDSTANLFPGVLHTRTTVLFIFYGKFHRKVCLRSNLID